MILFAELLFPQQQSNSRFHYLNQLKFKIMIRVGRVELVLQVNEVHRAELVPQGNLENRVTLVHQAKLYVKHL